MKIVCKLAFRSLLHDKKRFLLTLIGFILSVSAVAAIFGIADSVWEEIRLSEDADTVSVVGKTCTAFKTVACLMSVFSVYTAFSIDFEDRIREIGFLISVGISGSQRFFYMLFQGLIYAAAAVPTGTLLGYGIGSVFYGDCVRALVRFGMIGSSVYTVKVGSVLITLGAGLFVSVAASMIPFLKMRRMTAAETIRDGGKINVSLRQTLLSKLSEKLFGRIGTLAGQNYDNYKLRYRSVSLALSCGAAAFFAVYSFFYIPQRYAVKNEVTMEEWAESLYVALVFLGLYFVFVFLVCSLGSMRQTMEKRKREFAVYQSLGIGRGDMRTLLAVEFAFFTVYAILFTAIGSLAANYGITVFFRLVGGADDLPVYYPFRMLLRFAVFDIAVGIGMYLYSLVFTKKLDLIEAIRQY